MTKNTEKSFSIQNMFVILVLAVFLVFSMLMVVLGAMCYVGLEEKSQDVNNKRILQSFVRSTLAAREENSAVRVEDDLLIVEYVYEEINDEDEWVEETYRLYIYAHDGQLRQQFISAERAFVPDNGESICPAGLFRPQLEGNLLKVDMQDGSGQFFTMYEHVLMPHPEGGSL